MRNDNFRRQKEKTASGANGNGFINKNHLNFGNGTNDIFYFTHYEQKPQCKNAKCGNNDLKFSVDGFCIRCVQRVEFIIREKPQTIERAKQRGAKF